MHRSFSAALVAAVSLSTIAAAQANLADAITDYTPGSFAQTTYYSGYTDPSTALGPINGDTGSGYALNPFNPPFDSSQVVAVGAGGQLTLHMASPVVTGAAALGVFSNSGLDDTSGGSGQAFNPATTLDEDYGETDPEAIVEVSPDDVDSHFAVLNSGNPIVFTNPTNAYLDSAISNYFEPLGTQLADQYQPFTGTLASFNGKTFDQIKQLLNGSAGGNWLDLSDTGYSQISYVRFVVPAGATYGMVINSVSAVPEPALGLPLMIGTAALLRRRRQSNIR
jgi:hypothetical protein